MLRLRFTAPLEKRHFSNGVHQPIRHKARRAPEKAGTGVVFVTPIKGAKQIKAAKEAGFEKTQSLCALRILATNKPGMGAKIARLLGDAGINIQGFSGAAIGNRAVFHLAFDSAADANKAIRIIK
jgi:UTP:GlnB (protein PII) uridylyltransferase